MNNNDIFSSFSSSKDVHSILLCLSLLSPRLPLFFTLI